MIKVNDVRLETELSEHVIMKRKVNNISRLCYW